jgi:putative Mg2+ transporter-C (MgtC) family protein
LAGAVTGVGFIGGGLLFHHAVAGHEVFHGLTTASAIFATAAIGAAVGEDELGLAALSTLLILIVLEVGNIPAIRSMDADRWAARRQSPGASSGAAGFANTGQADGDEP